MVLHRMIALYFFIIALGFSSRAIGVTNAIEHSSENDSLLGSYLAFLPFDH
jgi:hypothetical protein